jgi:hypothetical protein
MLELEVLIRKFGAIDYMSVNSLTDHKLDFPPVPSPFVKSPPK